MLKIINKNNSSYFFFFSIVLNTFLGLQILKTFLTLLQTYYYDRLYIGLTDVLIYGLTTFILIFFTGYLFKIRYGHLIWILLGGISVVRIIIQFNPWPPLSLAVSALGTILWIVSFIFFISLLQQKKISLFYVFIPGFILGISLDTAIHGLLGTWDMVWRSTVFINLGILLTVAVKFWLIFNLYFELKAAKPADGRKTVFYTLIMFLPFVFLQFFKFQNIASHNAISGFNSIISTTIILASNIAAFAFIYLFNVKKAKLLITVIAAIVLILSFWPDVNGYFYSLQTFFGNISSFWLILAILNKAIELSDARNPWKNTFATGISGLLFFVFTFLYYGGYQIALPLKNWMLPLSLSAILGICALLSVTLKASPAPEEQIKESETKYLLKKSIALYLMISLLIVPILLIMPIKNNYSFKGELPVRIMNYNIRAGFNVKGYLDLEEIARVIEGNDADIVTMQEVSRGWVTNGCVDSLEWLSHRLDMHYFFMPAFDDVWGIAILSRYPMKIIKSGFLPKAGAIQRRSYIFVNVEIPGKSINICCTHPHHIVEQPEIREKQIQEILKQWNGLGRTAIMGDFNAEKGDKELDMMYSSGLIDSQFELGKGKDLTFLDIDTCEPIKRLDFIWTTPDLKISNFKVPFSTASDHLPVVVNVE